MSTTTQRRFSSRVTCAIVAGGLGLLPLAVGAGAQADTPPALGGWNVSADGNVIDMVLDNTTGLAGIHPFTEADFPEAESQFQTGPFGSALATVFWPGSAGGDFGSLSAELGIPAQLEPYFAKLNDPLRASTQYPAGPTSASYPPGKPNGAIDMESHAGATGTSATAALTDETVPSLIGFSSAKGTSSSTVISDAKATSNSDLGGISLLGGLIDIASIKSTATADSDGTTSSGSALTHVTGITVLGQPASIGSDGLILPNLNSTFGPLIGPIVENLLSQSVSAIGLKLSEFPSTQSQNGASETISSGGVQLEITPPSSAAPLLEQLAAVIAPYFPSQAAIVPTLPGLLQGATLTITLGRATATADASPPFNSSFNPPPLTPITLPTTPGTSAGVTSTPTAAPAAATPAATASPAASTPAVSTPPAPQALAATPISLSTPLGVGLLVLGLLVTAALGFGLWRLAQILVNEDAAPICPLGQENP